MINKTETKQKRIQDMKLEHLTNETFKEKIFNYETHKEWKFEGNTPAIIDFYADWCGPCKVVAPILEELKDEYGDKLDIYKVNTEEQRELSSIFGIQSIPSLLFIPTDGQPQMAMGALPKETFKQAISEVLSVNV
jgi:thioredoxin